MNELWRLYHVLGPVTNSWSDAARAASAEARRAGAKANKSGNQNDHDMAGQAHRDAWKAHVRAADNAEGQTSQRHMAKAKEHADAISHHYKLGTETKMRRYA